MKIQLGINKSETNHTLYPKVRKLAFNILMGNYPKLGSRCVKYIKYRKQFIILMLSNPEGNKCISYKKYCELFNIIRHVYLFDTFINKVKNFKKNVTVLEDVF